MAPDPTPDTAAWVLIDAEVHWREPRTPGVTFCGEVINKTDVRIEETPDDQDICERCWNLGCPRG